MWCKVFLGFVGCFINSVMDVIKLFVIAFTLTQQQKAMEHLLFLLWTYDFFYESACAALVSRYITAKCVTVIHRVDKNVD